MQYDHFCFVLEFLECFDVPSFRPAILCGGLVCHGITMADIWESLWTNHDLAYLLTWPMGTRWAFLMAMHPRLGANSPARRDWGNHKDEVVSNGSWLPWSWIQSLEPQQNDSEVMSCCGLANVLNNGNISAAATGFFLIVGMDSLLKFT